MLMQVIFPHLEDELDQSVSVLQYRPLKFRVPGFSGKADSFAAADAVVSGLLEDPWRHKIRIEDFGKVIKEAPE